MRHIETMTQRAALIVMSVLLANVADARPTLPRTGVPASIRYFEPVTRVTHHAVPGTRKLGVSLETLGKQLDLELEPNELFTQGAKDVWIGDTTLTERAPAIELYKGRVKGEPDSWVRLSMRNGGMDGMISTANEIYFV